MANNPSFSLYVNDFEGGTRHMTDEELGCYIRLLFAQFNREKLPNNPDFLRRFCTSFDKSWTIVNEKFEKIDENFIQNRRLETEIQKRDNFIDKQQDNGRKGGRPPNKSKPTKNPNKTQTKTQKKPLGNGYGYGKGKGSRVREGEIIFEENKRTKALLLRKPVKRGGIISYVFKNNHESMPNELFQYFLNNTGINNIDDYSCLRDKRIRSLIDWNKVPKNKILRLITRDTSLIDEINFDLHLKLSLQYFDRQRLFSSVYI